MNNYQLSVVILISGIIVASIVAVAYGGAADMNWWSYNHRVQEDITVTVTRVGALDIDQATISGGLK